MTSGATTVIKFERVFEWYCRQTNMRPWTIFSRPY